MGAIEDRAMRFDAERAELDARLAANTRALVDLTLEALQADIPIDGCAKLVGVDRMTVFLWREDARKSAKPLR